MTTITCERCGRTTTDPDLWDPEADTGRIFCNRCWDVRDEPRGMIAPQVIDDGDDLRIVPQRVALAYGPPDPELQAILDKWVPDA